MQNETQIFPPKEVAMELKRVNFDWGCIGWYLSDQDMDCTDPIVEGDITCNSSFLPQSTDSCSAPTYDQVIGWFAEVHGMLIVNVPDVNVYNNTIEYGWGILQKGQTIDSDYLCCEDDSFPTDRQQSLLTAFREAIKLIQK